MRITIALLIIAIASFYTCFAQSAIQRQSVFCNGGAIATNNSYTSISVVGEPVVSSFTRNSLSGIIGYLNKEDMVSPVGVDNIENHSLEFSVYPNPSDGNVVVELSSSTASTFQNTELRIFDMLGRTIYRQPVAAEKTTLSPGDFNNVSGVYVVALMMEQGIIGKEKVVVE